MAIATTNLTWNPKLPLKSLRHLPSFNCTPPSPLRHPSTFSTRAFRRSDLDNFARRLASGETWRDAWRSANNGFEVFIFEARKTAERIDRRYAVTRRLAAVAQSATDRALDLDREFEIRQRWRSFTIDFNRNWPRYRKELNDFLETPLGRGFATIFVLWFMLSGWLFRCLIFATWILPFAGPLLIGTFANNLIIKGECPACKRQFMGNKNQMVRCASCGNIVWQPKGDFTGGSGGPRGSSSKSSQPDIIDVEFEEK